MTEDDLGGPAFSALMAPLTFRATAGRVVYRNEANEVGSLPPFLYLELDPHSFTPTSKVRRFLAGRPATARLYSHETGEDVTGTGARARGIITFDEVPSTEDPATGETLEPARPFVEIEAFLPRDSFIGVVTALVLGGSTLLSRCDLSVRLQEHRDRVEYSRPVGPPKSARYLLNSVTFSFPIAKAQESLPSSEPAAQPGAAADRAPLGGFAWLVGRRPGDHR